MWQFVLSASLLLALSSVSHAGGNYWWMKDPSVFSSGSSGQHPQQQQQQHNSFDSSSQNLEYSPQDGEVETECPVGTKCVADHFCDENAIMVFTRVDLTPAQKRNRGKLIPCVNSGNGGFDVCCSTVGVSNTGSSFNNNNNHFSAQLQRQPSQTSFSSNNNIPTGECPNISQLPPVESCSRKASNCWSVGQADVDCPDNALCCFDGCVNACYFGGSSGSSSSFSSSSSTFSAPAPVSSFQSSSTSFSAPAPVPPPSFSSSSQTVFEIEPSPPAFQTPSSIQVFNEPEPAFEPSPPQPAFEPSPPQQSFPTQVHTSQTFSPAAPPASYPTQTFSQPRPQQPRPQQQPFSPPQKQTTFQSSSSTTFENADTKPFVTCPSAMKCVPRVNCDFNGVMVEQTLTFTAEMETLRVPLIPCINPSTTNIDVCCRDPNYQDPWPDMNNGNGNGNGNNGGNFGNNGGNFGNNGGNCGNNGGCQVSGGNFGNNANQGSSDNGILPRVSHESSGTQQQTVKRKNAYGRK